MLKSKKQQLFEKYQNVLNVEISPLSNRFNIDLFN